ncbi:MAG: hypothetical protein K9I94_08830 [Bacteroidales bacterium]|nr:hypothetical protein [Bacteroidales bacterium]
MKTISLKIEETFFRETESIRLMLNKSRNRYINEAIEHYNRLHKRNALEKKLQKESEMVKDDSMEVLKEFENLGYED